MAVKTFTVTEIATRGDRGHLVVWASLGNGDSGSPISMIGSPKRTIQAVGTFAGGATVVVQGSNDGTNWATLTNEHGTACSFAASGISSVTELPLYIRPLAVGDPAAVITMLLQSKGR